MPVVSVWSRPNGLPMAKTFCPTWRPALVPTRIGTSLSRRRVDLQDGEVLVAARSRRASAVVVVLTRASPCAESASCTTWKFVTMWPRSSQTKPEPGAVRDLGDAAGPEVHLLDLRRDEGDRARGAP